MLNSGADYYGASRICLEVATHLKQNGFEPVVIFPHDGPVISEFKKLNIEVYIKNLGVIRKKYLSPFGLFNRLYRFLVAYLFLTDLVKKRKIDIIYSNTLSVLVGALVSRRMNVPHMWHIHEIMENPQYLVNFFGWCLDKSKGQVLAVSEAVKACWSGFISNPQRIHVIYNGIAHSEGEVLTRSLREELNLPDELILIGMVGRVNKIKGQEYLLKIAFELRKKYSAIGIVFVGDAYPGNEKIYDELFQLKHDLQLQDIVYDLGYRADIANILRGLDIFILPSVMPDSFPTVILEAMGQSKAIVATAQGGALEMLVDGESGVFIPLNQPRIAADKIFELIMDRSFCQKLGAKAKQRVLEKFSNAAFEKSIIQIFRAQFSHSFPSRC